MLNFYIKKALNCTKAVVSLEYALGLSALIVLTMASLYQHVTPAFVTSSQKISCALYNHCIDENDSVTISPIIISSVSSHKKLVPKALPLVKSQKEESRKIMLEKPLCHSNKNCVFKIPAGFKIIFKISSYDSSSLNYAIIHTPFGPIELRGESGTSGQFVTFENNNAQEVSISYNGKTFYQQAPDAPLTSLAKDLRLKMDNVSPTNNSLTLLAEDYLDHDYNDFTVDIIIAPI